MVLVIGLTADGRLRETFLRLESISQALFEPRQASRGRLLDLLAEQDRLSRAIEENLKSSLTRAVRIPEEQYRLLEDEWGDGTPTERLDMALYDGARGLRVLEKMHRILAGWVGAGELEQMIEELRDQVAHTSVVFWTTGEDQAAAVSAG